MTKISLVPGTLLVSVASLWVGIAQAEKGKAPEPPPIVRTNIPPPIVQTVRTAPSDVTPFSTSGEWTVFVDHTLDSGCFLLAQWEGGTVFRIGFNAKNGSGYLLLGNEKWRSLETGKDYPISLQFDEEGPWEATASAVSLGGGRPFLGITFTRTDFLAEFMAKQALHVTYKGRDVEKLRLTGSAAAGAELLRCQEQMLATQDPFRGDGPSEQKASNDPFAL